MVKGSSDDWIPSGVIVVLQERERENLSIMYLFLSQVGGLYSFWLEAGMRGITIPVLFDMRRNQEVTASGPN